MGGVAYEFGDQVYDQPNRTMVSYAEGMMVKGKHKGMKKEMRSEEHHAEFLPMTFHQALETPTASLCQAPTRLENILASQDYPIPPFSFFNGDTMTYLWFRVRRLRLLRTTLRKNQEYQETKGDRCASRGSLAYVKEFNSGTSISHVPHRPACCVRLSSTRIRPAYLCLKICLEIPSKPRLIFVPHR